MTGQQTTPPLDRNLLVAEAQRRAGLDDLGDTWFFEPLDMQIKCSLTEAKLSEQGTILEAERIIGFLQNRLIRVQLLKDHPEILGEDVQVAAAIISLSRTGSTKTHRMVSATPGHTTLMTWEAQFPYPFPGEERGNPVERRKRAQELHDLMPDMSHIHLTGIDYPQEEAVIIEQSFTGTAYEVFTFAPSFSKYLETADQMPAYEELKLTLKILQWQDPTRKGQKWILKSPTHMSAPKTLLEAFPGSLMVQTHRDPLKSMPSHCSMISTLIGMKSEETKPADIGRFTCARWAQMSNDVIDLRETIGDDRFVDIQYQDLLDQPVEEARRIFDRMGTKFTEADEAAVNQWLVDNKREKWSPHIYDLETYGLTEEIIKSDFARYRARHIS